MSFDFLLKYHDNVDPELEKAVKQLNDFRLLLIKFVDEAAKKDLLKVYGFQIRDLEDFITSFVIDSCLPKTSFVPLGKSL